VYIILSKTNNNNENPIPCPEKINVLGDANDVTKTMINSLKQMMITNTTDPDVKSKIQRLRVVTICVPEVKGATPFTPVIQIVEAKKDAGIQDVNLFLIIGDDRKDLLDSITDTFFKRDNVHSVSGEILQREEMGNYKQISADPQQLDALVMSEVPVNAISASFVRNIVKNNRRDKFTDLYSPYLDEERIQGLYDSILRGITSLDPVKANQDGPEKPLRYSYPMIKGESEFPIKRVSETQINPASVKKRGGKKENLNKKTNKTNKIISILYMFFNMGFDFLPKKMRSTKRTKRTKSMKRTKSTKKNQKGGYTYPDNKTSGQDISRTRRRNYSKTKK
jgi:nicotinic acid mononucleotide adenylyltransferase